MAGPAGKMHLVIKTGCVHHGATQLPDGQDWRMGETSQALVSQASKRTQFFNITLGSWWGKKQNCSLFDSAPRGSHAKEPQALDLCSNQINLQCFDFKGKLLCRPNTTGLLGAQRRWDVRLEARQAHSTIQAEKKTKRDQDTVNNRIHFPASFLAWAPWSTLEQESHEAQALPSLLSHRRNSFCTQLSIFSLSV